MKIKVEFEVEVEIPDGTTEEDIDEWVSYETGENGEMSGSNPLAYTELVPLPFSVNWEEV